MTRTESAGARAIETHTTLEHQTRLAPPEPQRRMAQVDGPGAEVRQAALDARSDAPAPDGKRESRLQMPNLPAGDLRPAVREPKADQPPGALGPQVHAFAPTAKGCPPDRRLRRPAEGRSVSPAPSLPPSDSPLPVANSETHKKKKPPKPGGQAAEILPPKATDLRSGTAPAQTFPQKAPATPSRAAQAPKPLFVALSRELPSIEPSTERKTTHRGLAPRYFSGAPPGSTLGGRAGQPPN